MLPDHIAKLDPAAPHGPGDTSPSRLAVVSKHAVFRTLQGEGIFAGVPSVFLRLYGCNLSCSWCDTKNSWTRPDKNRIEAGIEQLRSSIYEHDARHLVITGGEPVLQQGGILMLLQSFWSKYSNCPKVTLETNGIVQASRELLSHVHLLSVSPKLHEKTDTSALLEYVCAAHENVAKVQIKLVVSNATELDAAILLLDKATVRGSRVLDKEHCFIHPEWGTYGTRFSDEMMEEIIGSGYRLGYQQHKTWKLL